MLLSAVFVLDLGSSGIFSGLLVVDITKFGSPKHILSIRNE